MRAFARGLVLRGCVYVCEGGRGHPWHLRCLPTCFCSAIVMAANAACRWQSSAPIEIGAGAASAPAASTRGMIDALASASSVLVSSPRGPRWVPIAPSPPPAPVGLAPMPVHYRSDADIAAATEPAVRDAMAAAAAGDIAALTSMVGVGGAAGKLDARGRSLLHAAAAAGQLAAAEWLVTQVRRGQCRAALARRCVSGRGHRRHRL